MDQVKLKIGMPAGSLADPNRGGNLVKLLENSGFKTSGYESGGPSQFSTANYFFGWDGRPQEFSSQLGIGELDVAIAGDDWIKERILEFKIEYNTEINLERVLPLKRGGVRIVGIINDPENKYETIEAYLTELSKTKDIITVATEMPYISLDWLQQKLAKIGLSEKYPEFSVQKYKTPAKIKKGIVMYETWGKTEAKVKNMGTDLGMEITQTGSAIRNYQLKIVEEILQSQTSIWINPKIKEDPEKYELLEMFLLNLYGTINAENKVLIAFNVPNKEVNTVEKYLSDNNLFADEPTISVGKAFTVYNIQVDSIECPLPLAKIRFDLAKLGSKNINTMPIQSSISGINTINL